MLLSISVHLTMEPKQKKRIKPWYQNWERKRVHLDQTLFLFVCFHLNMYQWHLTKRYSDISHVQCLGQIQSPWLTMKPLGFPYTFSLIHWCRKGKLHLGSACFKTMVAVLTATCSCCFLEKNFFPWKYLGSAFRTRTVICPDLFFSPTEKHLCFLCLPWM